MSATGAQLAQDRVDRWRSLGAFGKPAYQSHVQLRAMLLAQRKEQLANYFAKPNYDPDTGELRWTAELAGAPRRLAELGADEAARGVEAMGRIHAELLAFVDELRRKGGAQPGGAAAFASLLEQAMKVPAQGDFLFFIGDQPVIAFWGFEDQLRGSVDPAAPAPQYAAGASTEAAAMPPPAELPRPRRPWWHWLLGLLLVLLAAAALLLLPRACAPAASDAAGDGAGPKTAGLDAGRDLEIPPGALERGDLSFLAGLWQLGEGRFSEYRDRPDNVIGSGRSVLDFRADGSGTAYGVERMSHGPRERSGPAVPDCSGALQARTDGKKLYFTIAGCETPSMPQRRMNGSEHECARTPKGTTHCQIVNQDGHRWDAPLRRLK